MRNKEEYEYEAVKEYLHKNLSLIIVGQSLGEERTHYIVEQFKETSIPIVTLSYDESSNKYHVEYTENGTTTTKRDATFVNLHSILESLPSISFRSVLVDITSLQHVVIMYLTHVLLTKISVAHLFMSYVKPKQYLKCSPLGKYELYTQTFPVRAIPGISSRYQGNEIIIPFLGFDGDRFNNAIEGMSYEEIDPIVGFPSDNPYWQIESLRTCMIALKATSSEQNIRKCKANSIYDAYQTLEEILNEKPKKNFVLIPLGTRPHSVACALFNKRHSNVRIIYDFAKESTIRSKGVKSVVIYNLSPFLA